MSEKTAIEKIIKLRQKYKAEYDSYTFALVNSIRKQLLARIVNDLTDVLCSEGKEGRIQ